MTRPSETEDLYHRLGVSRDASSDEIKKAYREASMRWHPDMNDDKEASHLEFLAVSEAYETLSGDIKRTNYDTTGSYSPMDDEDARRAYQEFMNEISKKYPVVGHLLKEYVSSEAIMRELFNDLFR